MRSKIAGSAVAGLIGAALTIGSVPASAGDATGVWLRANGASKIRIESCGAALCGVIAWERSPRKDTMNPDPARRDEPLLGRRILIDMKPTGTPDRWKGEVYNAEDGKTYTGFAGLQADGTLKLEGCVLGGLICKSDVWSRSR